MRRYWKIYMHLAWSTKARTHIIRGTAERQLHQAIRETARQLEMVPIAVNSAWNHTHALLSWNPALSPDDVVEDLKHAGQARWSVFRNQCNHRLPSLYWQEGYGGFSVSPGRVSQVKKYIVLQKDLHRTNRTLDHFEAWSSIQ